MVNDLGLDGHSNILIRLCGTDVLITHGLKDITLLSDLGLAVHFLAANTAIPPNDSTVSFPLFAVAMAITVNKLALQLVGSFLNYDVSCGVISRYTCISW